MLPIVLFALSLAFGPQIIELSLQLDDSARQSLRNAPDTGVPATLTYQDAGREQRFAVTVRIKGQKGSARPIDDKPAFQDQTGQGRAPARPRSPDPEQHGAGPDDAARGARI